MSKVWERVTAYWQDAANLVLVVWLVISPLVLNFAGNEDAAKTCYYAGGVIAVFAIAALWSFQNWEEWSNAVVGAWLMGSPWVMHFSDLKVATWNVLIVGLLILILSLWSAFASHGAGPQVTDAGS